MMPQWAVKCMSCHEEWESERASDMLDKVWLCIKCGEDCCEYCNEDQHHDCEPHREDGE